MLPMLGTFPILPNPWYIQQRKERKYSGHMWYNKNTNMYVKRGWGEKKKT